jgi:hypothetical protein
MFKPPNPGSQAACFAPAEINLKGHLKSLGIATDVKCLSLAPDLQPVEAAGLERAVNVDPIH